MSEALEGAKLRYSELDKMAYAVVMASQKLKHYFTIHPITIPTSYPLRDVFENREAIERISNWVAELVPFTLSFITRSTIKLQALAEFIINWTPTTPVGSPPVLEPVSTTFVNGAYGASGAGAAAILSSPSGQEIRYALRLDYLCTNNTIEYEALVLALQKSDSQVVTL